MKEILIYDQIGYDWWSDSGITLKDIKSQIDAAIAKGESILIRINSPGGSVSEGLGIYNYIVEKIKDGHEIKTKNDGIAMSMAAVILLAADKPKTPKTTVTLLHNAWGGVVGNARDLKAYAELLDAFDEALANAVSLRTGKPLQEIKDSYFDYRDHTLTGQQMIDLGLGVEDDDDTIDAKAAVKLPEGIENLKPEEILAWYRSQMPGAKKQSEASFIERIAASIKNTLFPNQPNNTMKIKILASMAAIAAVLNVKEGDEIEANASVLENLSNHISAKNTEVTNLTNALNEANTAKANAENALKAANEKIAELQAKLDQSASPTGAKGATEDKDPTNQYDPFEGQLEEINNMLNR